MPHSLLFYPDLIVTWVSFSKSGGKTLKRGKLPAFPCTSSPSCCPGQGADTPRTKTLCGRGLCLLHSPVPSHWKSCPHPGGPVHAVSAWQACSSQRCPVQCRPPNCAGCSSRRYRCCTETEPPGSPTDSPSTGHKPTKTSILIHIPVFMGVCGLETWYMIKAGESAESWELRFSSM